MTRIDPIVSILLLLGALGLVFSYFARIRLKGRITSDRIERQGASPILSKTLMEAGYWSMQPLCKNAMKLGLSANFISYLALLFGVATGICFAQGHFGLGSLFGTAGGMLDALDGMVARATGTMNQSGKVLDSALDRYVEFAMLSGALIYFHGNLVAQSLTLLALIGSFMVSYSTALAEITQTSLPRGAMQRPERLTYLILGAALSPIFSSSTSSGPYPLLISLGLMAIVANISAIFRIQNIRHNIEQRQQRVISMTLAQVRSVRSPRSGTR